jgi:hypothetical protein
MQSNVNFSCVLCCCCANSARTAPSPMFLPDSLAGWVVALGAAALICLLLQSEDTPAAEPAGGGGADAPTCRICYAGAEAGRLFTPCLCRGSLC